jgi:hypothetical protein
MNQSNITDIFHIAEGKLYQFFQKGLIVQKNCTEHKASHYETHLSLDTAFGTTNA